MFNLSKAPVCIQAAAEKSKTFKILAMEDGDTPELLIMDYIGEDIFGEGVSATQVKEFLSKHKSGNVRASFNSFGGDAYQGVVMHNAFREHGNVTSVIEGIAFSAASIAASGAKKIVMNEASNFGIHHALTGLYGNRFSLSAAIEWLDSVDEHQINIFTKRTGESRETVLGWLKGTDDGTVFSSADALKYGFADEVIPINQAEESEKTTEKPEKAAVAYHRIAAEWRQKRLKAAKIR